LAVVHISSALEQNADSVIITNRDGVIEYVNPAFEVIAGFSKLEAVGQTPAIMRSGIQTPHFYATLWNTLLSGRPFQTIITNRRRDGQLFDLEQTISPIRNPSGAITHFVSTGRDVTQERRTEAARLHQQLEQESARVATLLHADAGQLLTSAHLTLANIAGGLDEAGRQQIGEVRQTLERVEEQLRRVARGAQPRVIADLGLVDAIRYLSEDCVARTSLSMTIDSTIDRRCTATAETLIYRFVQETLGRVPPSPRPDAGRIVLRREVRGRRAQDETLCCSIHIPSAPDDRPTASRGALRDSSLRLVRERLEAVGGSLVSRVPETGGIDLLASVPMSA